MADATRDRKLALDPDRLIFIAETGLSTKMARLRGRPARGERCRAPVPHGHGKATTLTAGLRRSGLVAPWLLDGAMGVRLPYPPPYRGWNCLLTARTVLLDGRTGNCRV
ncbi:MAG: hypothetical protein AcusKO_29010 [Acuticoccus sp.]